MLPQLVFALILLAALEQTCAFPPRSCQDLFVTGSRTNKEYTIWIDGITPTNVYCDMTTDGGGWTVIQRRADSGVDFFRGWNEYKNGFGSKTGSFWQGLDVIHALTAHGAVLRVELKEFDGKSGYAKYSHFSVWGETASYKLSVSGYSGTAGDAMSYHNNMLFTTIDRDNDGMTFNCAYAARGAWWYYQCYNANLNGLHRDFSGLSQYKMTWLQLSNREGALVYSEMKIRVPATPASLTSSPRPTSKMLYTDVCKNYQILSEQSRFFKYKDHENRCDNNLHGWYRFRDNAGSMMMNSCPFKGNSSGNLCGSSGQGWIQGTHPELANGVVDRMVCFSTSYNCSCMFQKAVKVKNCGTFYVYWINGVPNCNMSYCGVKERMVHVSCSDNYMRVDLDRRYYNASQYSDISLSDPTCAASFSSAYITLGTVPSLCGSRKVAKSKKIMYQNRVVMTLASNKSNLITRDDDEIIDFSCTYDQDGYASGASFKPIKSITTIDPEFGKFSFNFTMHTSASYERKYYTYPVDVKMRDWLYFQATASVQDSSLVLLIDQCYSTPNMDRSHKDKYIFINNGCPTDKTMRFHNGNQRQQRFSIQAYRHFGKTRTVFVHCLLFLCPKTSRDFRCQSGCAGNNVNRVRRDIGNNVPFTEKSSSKYYLLEEGPIVLQSDQEEEGKSSISVNNLVISLSIGIGAMAVVVIILVIKRKRPRPDRKRNVTEIGIDNNAVKHASGSQAADEEL